MQVPPQVALQQRGPFLQVTVGVASAITKELAEQGAKIPNVISGLALIDTGANITCIDDEAAQQIGAPAIDKVQMTSASHANVDANIYPLHFELAGSGIHIDALRCMGAALKAHGLIALIGRDVLSACTLHYNGVSGQFTISM